MAWRSGWRPCAACLGATPVHQGTNVPEIKKFIGSYVQKVIVYKDHCEVVFFFCAGSEKAGYLCMTVKVFRRQMVRRGVAVWLVL